MNGEEDDYYYTEEEYYDFIPTMEELIEIEKRKNKSANKNIEDDEHLGAEFFDPEYYEKVAKERHAAISQNKNITTKEAMAIVDAKEAAEKAKEEDITKKEGEKKKSSETIPIVSESSVKEEIKKEEKKGKKKYDTKGRKNNYADKGDKDVNNPYMYARIILDNEGYIFWTTDDDRLCHIYKEDDGMYDFRGEASIRRRIQEISDSEFRGVRENIKREVINIIKDRTLKPKPGEDEYDHLLLCENGIYNVKDNKFTKGFNSDYFITSRIPWPYNNNARCPEIIGFIKEVIVPKERWENLSKLDINKILFVQELFGYCLYRKYPFHYMFILLGKGDNGKGILLRLFTKFVGRENVSGVAPQNLDKRFQSANLYGKQINMFGDLPAGKLRDTGTIKTLIGEDLLTAEFKGQDPFNFTSYAKIIVSTNEPFAIAYGEPEAFFRKIIPLYFPNRFAPDEKLFERITTKEQMSGLLNWAIIGLGRLLKNKAFSLRPKPEKVVDLFPRWGIRGDHERAILDIKDVGITSIDEVYEE